MQCVKSTVGAVLSTVERKIENGGGYSVQWGLP